MFKHSLKVFIFSTALIFCLVVLPANVAAALGSSTNPTVDNRLSQSSNIQTKLTDVRLRACKNREKAINGILVRIANRGQKQLELFSAIADRAETFYIGSGRTAANYGVLLAAVKSQEETTRAAVDSVRSDSVSFKCDGTDPKGAAQLFKNDLKIEISALNAYRLTVKDLIVGIKSAGRQGTGQ